MHASTADEAIWLISPRELTLEKAIEFIAGDEHVEVTSKSMHLRKKILEVKKSPRRWEETCAGTECFA